MVGKASSLLNLVSYGEERSELDVKRVSLQMKVSMKRVEFSLKVNSVF